MVDVEIDYSRRHGLAGFPLGVVHGRRRPVYRQRGHPRHRRHHHAADHRAASLYTLGVAYMIAPDQVEQFLAANWPTISKLLTDHGPWEGFNLAKQEAIRVQTSAHTLSLILGCSGPAPKT